MVSADKVKELRVRSGAGIMDCKRALHATSGDLQEAIDFLRKEGVVKAGKKVGREVHEGLIGLSVSPNGESAALVEINCETDFVARTDDFQRFVDRASEEVLNNGDFSQDSLKGDLQEMIARLGENMSIRRFARLKVSRDESERIGSYLHAGAKIGVLVRLRGKGLTEEVSRDVAMHVAAMHPAYMTRESVPEAVILKEKEIMRATPEVAKKPPEIAEKIIQGKLGRFFSDTCLLEQPFVKDTTGKKTVGSYLREIDPAAEVQEVVRFQVGGNE